MKIYLISLGRLSLPLDGSDNLLAIDNVKRLALSPIVEDEEEDGHGLQDRYWRELTIEAWETSITLRLSSNDQAVLKMLDVAA